MFDPVKKCARRRAGFTLLELMIVMVILAVLSVAVTPIFRTAFADTRKEHAVRDLVATLQHAQSMAITEAVEYRVYVAHRDNAYWVEHLVSHEEGRKQFERTPEFVGRTVQLPDTLKVQRPRARKASDGSNTYFIAFYPSGTSDEARLIVALAKKAHKKYEISAEGGRIEFEAPDV